MSDVDGLRERLEVIAEELADVALERLRAARRAGTDGADERRVTRARRAVEKAVVLLREDAAGGD